MKKPLIIAIGEVLWDRLPTGSRLGGAPANFACHAAILGADVTLVSAVGEDSSGAQAVEILGANNIDVSLIQKSADAKTGNVEVELDQYGKPTYEIQSPSAWDRISWNEGIASRISMADAVYFGTLGQRGKLSRETTQRLVHTAEEREISRVLDINLRPPFFDAQLITDSIELANILKLSDEELDVVCSAYNIAQNDQQEVRLGHLREATGLEMIVMTKGADGAVLRTADETIQQEGIPATVVDTIGAGDSFTASFLIGELANTPRQENLRQACQVAAAACEHSGAIPAARNDVSPF